MNTWIDRLPRPDRSGVIGAVMIVNLWLAVVTPFGGGIPGICEIMPWKCQVEEVQERQRRQYHTVELAFYGHGKSHICACHYDVRLKAENGLIHHTATGEHAYSCGTPTPLDDEFNGVANEWHHVGVLNQSLWSVSFRTKPVLPTAHCEQEICFMDSIYTSIILSPEDELRSHCTDDPEYIREYGEVINAKE